MLILPIQEHGISLHLLVSSLISFITGGPTSKHPNICGSGDLCLLSGHPGGGPRDSYFARVKRLEILALSLVTTRGFGSCRSTIHLNGSQDYTWSLHPGYQKLSLASNPASHAALGAGRRAPVSGHFLSLVGYGKEAESPRQRPEASAGDREARGREGPLRASRSSKYP